jgi:hypothetical protein
MSLAEHSLAARACAPVPRRMARKTTVGAKTKTTHHPKRKIANKLHQKMQPANYVLEPHPEL